MEDYEYFVILEKLAGRTAVTNIVNEIAPNWREFSKDPETFYTAREKLAKEIMRLKQ